VRIHLYKTNPTFVQNEPELAYAKLSWARAAPVRT
jgi:hypothetical protein